MDRIVARKRQTPHEMEVDGKTRKCPVYTLDYVWRDGNDALNGVGWSSQLVVARTEPVPDVAARVLIFLPDRVEDITLAWNPGRYKVGVGAEGRVEVVDVDSVGLEVFVDLAAWYRP